MSNEARPFTYTVPGMEEKDAAVVIEILQRRLHALNDLALTLKHIHWNVVGPHWGDYSLGRDDAIAHLGALNVVYDGVVGDHRAAIGQTEELDAVTQDMLIGQSAELEQFQWFVRAHLENSQGRLSTASATTERGAARQAG